MGRHTTFVARHMEVSINGDTPIAGWFIRENLIYKFMITRGTHISGKLHIPVYKWDQ